MKRVNISKAFLTEKKNEEDEMNKQKIMKEIERKTEAKVLTAIATGQITNPLTEKNNGKKLHNVDALQSILSNSATEFQEKMGRNMTYGEMREMYG
jgi:hypothetical protein